MPTARRSPAPAPVLPRALLACALAACVILAGCGSVTGGPSTAAPAADRPPSAASASPSAPGTPPPGVSASGLENASALAAAHRRAAAAEGVVLVARTTVRRHGPPVLDGPENRTRTRRAVAAPGLERYRERRRTVDADGCLAVDRWANGSTAARRSVRAAAPVVGTAADPDRGGDDGPLVDYGPAPSTAAAAELSRAGLVERTLARAASALDLVSVRPAANGSRAGAATARRYVLSTDGSGPERDGDVEADRIGRSVRVVVDARGRVRALQSTVVRTEWTKWGATRRVRSVSYRVVATGVAPGRVPRPRWLDAARDAGALDRAAAADPTDARGGSDDEGGASTGAGVPAGRATATPPTGPPAPLDDRDATACGRPGAP
jgi:hypothetical protein